MGFAERPLLLMISLLLLPAFCTRTTNFSRRREVFATRAFKSGPSKTLGFWMDFGLEGNEERSLRYGSTYTVEPPVGMTNNCVRPATRVNTSEAQKRQNRWL